MFGNNNKKQKKKSVGTFTHMKELTNSIFRNREYNIEKKELSENDKKAAILTAIIILGTIGLLWVLPFTHQFIVDFLTFKI